jgi:hypothetical protein
MFVFAQHYYIQSAYMIDRFIQFVVIFHILLLGKSFLIFQKIFHSISKFSYNFAILLFVFVKTAHARKVVLEFQVTIEN